MQLSHRLRSHLRSLDWLLILAVVVILAFGMMAIVSVTLSHTPPSWGTLSKQLIVALIGFALLFFGSMVDYRSLAGSTRFFYVVALAMLLLVLFFGDTLRGTRGWFVIGGVSLQPVEFVKWFFLIILAKYFATFARDMDRLRSVVLSGLTVGVLAVLVFLQPDLGSAFLFFAVWFGMLILSGTRVRHLILLTAATIAVVIGAWFFLLHDYQHERLRVFLDPGRDPLGRGYNITQARIAVGSGQLYGSGLGFGSQSQLKFLPEAETDFIFAVIAEELGFIGVLVLFAAFALLFWRMLLATRRVEDDFALFFLYSATLLIFLEFVVTVGMNIGFLPVTGLTLPFASVGGSSLLAHFFILATVESILARRRLAANGTLGSLR